jgi:hypothetical protein
MYLPASLSVKSSVPGNRRVAGLFSNNWR